MGRIALRLPLVVIATTKFFVFWLLGYPIARMMQRQHIWRAAIFRNWARLLLWVLGAEVTVAGTPPRTPFLLVSNHLSYCDIPLLASRIDSVFVAKSDVASWPVIGTLCNAMGTVFINRESRRDLLRVSDQMHTLLASGQGLVVFPEGTTTDGSTLGRFRPSLLEVPVQLEQPVQYASIAYETFPGDPPASRSICWWGDMTLFPHFFDLLALEGFRARLTFGEREILAADRKALARELHQAISDQLFPTAGYGAAQCL